MDVSTFYALFSATCFTLTGLWWSVVEKHRHWLRDPGMRRRVGSVYLAFLLPALMGLFAQIGGARARSSGGSASSSSPSSAASRP